MRRKIKTKVKGFRTRDGAGVSLVRVLGRDTVKDFDPILMLDSFDSTNPEEYTAGFPTHPHRGIETISYLSSGRMKHRDSLGNEDTITSGEVQWMNSGSGIMHEELVPASDRLLGVQLWLNLPSKEKMSRPTYHSIRKADIPEVPFEGGFIRVLAGKYKDIEGYQGEHLPLTYYDVNLGKNSKISIDMDENDSVMVFTLLGDVYINDEYIEEKTAVKLVDGDSIDIENKGDKAQILYISSKSLNEPVYWAGPIVMNSHKEIQEAYKDLRENTFVKDVLEY